MTHHPEAAAFLAAIAANPDDDTPRLIFADWLDEHGEPERAEFVRCQIELAKPMPQVLAYKGWQSPTDTTSPYATCDDPKEAVRRAELRRRERDLWTNHGWGWLNQVPVALPFVHQGHHSFRRGFLSRLRCSWADCAAHLDTILADTWVPGLDEVELTTWPDWRAWDNLGTVVDRLGALASRVISAMLTDVWPKEKVRSWKLPPEPSLIDNLSGYWSMDEGT